MASLFDIGISGLRAQQTALAVTGQNITNASTPGYSRQRVEIQPQNSTLTGSEFSGAGVRAGDVTRIVDEFTISQIRTDTSLFSEMDGLSTLSAQVETVLSDAGAGLDSVLQEFFSALQSAANEPRSVPARQYLLSQGQSLSQRFASLDTRLDNIGRGVDVVLAESAERVNELASTIADFNDRIAVADAQSRSGAANPLKDQRDQALEELSGLIRVTTSSQGGGQLNVFVGKGQALVLGTTANSLSVSDGELYLSSGRSQKLQITGSADGGEIGGLLKFREQVLNSTLDQLGRLANAVASNLNEVHQRGVDLNGNFGGPLFAELNAEVAARARIEAVAGQSAQSAGSLRVLIDEPNGSYANEYELTFNTDSSYSVIRREDGAAVAQGDLTGATPETVSFDGLSIVFESDDYSAGDRFSILPNRSGAGLFNLAVSRVEDLALAAPVRIETNEANLGSGSLVMGQVFDVDHPVFSQDSSLVPPLLVRFNSQSSYDVLDNSDPLNPKPLQPPLAGLPFVPGQSNELLPESLGFTALTANGDRVARVSEASLGVLGNGPGNGYQSETLTISRDGVDQRLDLPGGQSAQATASALSGVAGVSASARTELSLVGFDDNNSGAAMVVAINGLRIDVDGEVTPNALADAISADPRFQALDIVASSDGDKLDLRSLVGEDLTISVTGDTVDGLAVVDTYGNSTSLRGTGPGTSAVLSGTTDLSGGFDFSVGGPYSFDLVTDLGVPSTISLTANYASGAALVAGIQSELDSQFGPDVVSVGLAAGGELTLTSVAVGDDALLEISNVSGAVLSGLGVPNSQATGEDQYQSATVGGTLNLIFEPGVALSSNGNSVFSGAPQAERADFGFTASLSGRPEAGDRFEIQFNNGGMSDSRNALDMLDLRTASLVGDPSLTFTETYGELVSFVGSASKEAQVGRDAADALLSQAKAQREAVSGVNLDEEAVDLIRFEQAYNASARIISVAREMFSILFNTVA
ncbi:MAG: flagellar hook-associated protein FlgK [Pseudomonadaceae bacterium]|nr:flagellar hook-associated protein FlgK [Pseudomonadaceae bacterium]